MKKGQLLARVDSPELMSRRAQERSTLLALQSDLGRQEIAARQSALRQHPGGGHPDHAPGRGRAGDDPRPGAPRRRACSTAWTSSARRTTWRSPPGAGQRAARPRSSSRRRLEFEVQNRRLQVARQQSVVQETERQVQRLEIAAPFDGMVATVNVQDRDAVPANAPDDDGRQPARRSRSSSTWPRTTRATCCRGRAAEILYEGKTYPGKVTAVSPEIRDSQVRGHGRLRRRDAAGPAAEPARERAPAAGAQDERC